MAPPVRNIVVEEGRSLMDVSAMDVSLMDESSYDDFLRGRCRWEQQSTADKASEPPRFGRVRTRDSGCSCKAPSVPRRQRSFNSIDMKEGDEDESSASGSQVQDAPEKVEVEHSTSAAGSEDQELAESIRRMLTSSMDASMSKEDLVPPRPIRQRSLTRRQRTPQKTVSAPPRFSAYAA
ncbi:expressed unknown protein [Seminavis robusta]|uniref:Uncharacterized protein n=1 Tax=Seminavis robusta TaxID=568900 RepID=A0A9N8EL00_9STRA|nr:expressed unknown protein [Seminavis robusta]|eukprot:Sro1446_g273460.1 n/a (179) ;mRNA; r:15839-16375